MAMLCKRLLDQGSLKTCFYRGLYTTQVQCVTIKGADKKPDVLESYDAKNTRLQRPQSPHLTIYRPQLTSMLSISHRFTGMALSSYVMALGLGALALPNDMPHYLTMIEDMHLSPAVFSVMKFMLAFPLAYHYCNGIRHLLWDLGKNLTIKQVYLSGYIMLSCAVALTAFLVSL